MKEQPSATRLPVALRPATRSHRKLGISGGKQRASAITKKRLPIKITPKNSSKKSRLERGYPKKKKYLSKKTSK